MYSKWGAWWGRWNIDSSFSNKYLFTRLSKFWTKYKPYSKSIPVSTFPEFRSHVVDFLSYIQWCLREQERPQSTSTAYPPPATASPQARLYLKERQAIWPRHPSLIQTNSTESIRPIRGHYRFLPMLKKRNHGSYVPHAWYLLCWWSG